MFRIHVLFLKVGGGRLIEVIQLYKKKIKVNLVEAATDTIFSNICYLFPGARFLLFFQESLSGIRLFDERAIFYRNSGFLLSNAYHFPKSPCLFSRIFRLNTYIVLQATFSSTRISRRSIYSHNEQIFIFQEASSNY